MQERRFVLATCLAAPLAGAAYVAPALLQGQDTPVLVRDLLDSTFTWITVLADEGQLWAGPLEPVQPLAGIARGYLPGPFSPLALLLLVLPPFAALTLLDLLTHAVAFAGMALLARDLLRRFGHPAPFLPWLLALAFAALPFFLGAGLSVAAQPLLLWALLRLRQGASPWLWLVPPLFALASSLVLVGVFVLLVLAAWVALDLLGGRGRAALRLAGAGLLLTAGYLVGEWGLLTVLREGPPTHRGEMLAGTGGLGEALEDAQQMYRRSQYHAEANPTPLLRRLVEAALLLALLARVGPLAARLRRCWPRLAPWLRPLPSDRALAGLFLAIVAIALLYGLWRWDALQAWRAAAGLPSFNLARFHWLLPTLWYLALPLALLRLLPGGLLARPSGLLLAAGLCLWQGALALNDHQAAVEAERSGLSYRQFFAAELFAAVRTALGPDADAPLVSVGLHPAVAQYNGFRTLDGYFNLYPQAYKEAFRPVIAPALEADPATRRFFDDWGSRVYLPDPALLACSYVCYPGHGPDSLTLRIDPAALRHLGGRFLLAAVPLDNADALGLEALGRFADPATPLVIHLYALRPGGD